MNMLRKVSLPGVLLGALACAATAQSDSSGSSPRPAPPPAAPLDTGTERAATHAAAAPCRASKLLGKDIVDADAMKLGAIKDIVIEDSGALVALVERPGAKLAGVPFDVLEVKGDGREPGPGETPEIKAFQLQVATEKLVSAPQTSDAARVDRAWLSRVREHFHAAAGAAGTAGAAGDASMPDPESASGAGSERREGAMGTSPDEAASDSATTPLLRAEALLGKDATSPRGQELGSIADLAVIVPESRVAYAIVSTGGLLGMGATLHAVSWKSVSLDAAGKNCVVSVDVSGLETSPGIDLDHLPAHPDLQMSSTAAPLGMGPVTQEPRR